MRKAALFLLLITFISPSVLSADQKLTITLEPTDSQAQYNSSQNNSRHGNESTSATLSGTKGKTQSKYTSPVKKSKDQVVIGRVGVIIASKANIKSVPNRKGITYFTCPKDTYLAVAGQNGSWYGVLMIDSSIGWIEKSKVSLLDYEVKGSANQAGSNSSIVNTALKYLGIPYRWGGTTSNGIDCSAFVRSVYASHGITLPRVARDQALAGIAVSWNDLQPGDRLYFNCKGGSIDHAGIYMGNGYFIHSSISRGGVAIDKITKPLFIKSLVAARR